MSEFPTLFHKGSSGAIYSWRIWTENADICTEYGQIDGKKQLARKTATTKNEGKSNETTPEEQAILQAKSMHTHRLERKYRISEEEAKNDEIFLPMLAAKWEDRKNQKKDGIVFPCSIQRKLNGNRCLIFWEEDELTLLSRGGKDFNLPHIVEALKNHLPKNLMLDGELYHHGTSLQTINSWIKKEKPETKNIVFNAYDCVDLDAPQLTWPDRLAMLTKWHSEVSNSIGSAVALVETLTVNNEDEAMKLFSEFLSEGYEGAIARMHDGEYRFGYRSKRLLKIKEFMDEEFPVVGWKTGVGRYSQCPIWRCKTKEGKEFDVVPKGTMEEKAQMLEEAESFMGEKLTVQFFEYSKDGIPVFPVGIAFRLKKDLP